LRQTLGSQIMEASPNIDRYKKPGFYLAHPRRSTAIELKYVQLVGSLDDHFVGNWAVVVPANQPSS
jgi:hypothetical protein